MTSHCPHLLLSAVLRRRCCWLPAAVDRYLPPARRSPANRPLAAAAVKCWDRQTDGQTDTGPFHRPWRVVSLSFVANNSLILFSYLCTLTTWHCPHSPVARRCCNDQYLLLARLLYSSKPAAAGLLLLVNAGTDRRTPYRFINSGAHIVQAVPISLILHFSVGLLSIFVVYQTEHRVCVRQMATHCTQRPLLYRRITADALLYARAFQFAKKSFDSIRFDSPI